MQIHDNLWLRQKTKVELGKGFTILELMVVVFLLALLSAIGLPYFLSIINEALLVAAKATLIDSHKGCYSSPSRSFLLPSVPGISFFGGDDCQSILKAEIGGACCISIDLGTGSKDKGFGWPSNFSDCSFCLRQEVVAGAFSLGVKVNEKGLLPNMDGLYQMSISPAQLRPGEIAPIMATGGRHEIHLFAVGVDRESYKLLALGDLQYISLGNPQWATVVESPPQPYGQVVKLGLEHESKGWSNRSGLALLLDGEIYEDYADTKDITHDNPSESGRESTYFGAVHTNTLQDPLKALNRLGINALPGGTRIFEKEITELSKYNGEISDVMYIDSMVHRANTRENGVKDFQNSTDAWLFGHREALSDPDFASKHPDSIKFSSKDSIDGWP